MALGLPTSRYPAAPGRKEMCNQNCYCCPFRKCLLEAAPESPRQAEEGIRAERSECPPTKRAGASRESG